MTECYLCKKVNVKNYQPEYCCTGFECSCGGRPIEPPICEKCEKENAE